MVSIELKHRLTEAVDKYETESFIKTDPVQFPHRYEHKQDIEISGLTAALMSFGNRKQIIKKVGELCTMMGESPCRYVAERKFEKDFHRGDSGSFYRMISKSDFREVFEKLYTAYYYADCLEDYIMRFQGNAMQKMCGFLGISPKSPQKKVNMFLRWMVRKNSPVDLGIWKKFDSGELIIPLDTHVLHVAKALGITANETYSLVSAKRITNTLSEVFPGDPVKGDFALFGLGTDSALNERKKH